MNNDFAFPVIHMYILCVCVFHILCLNNISLAMFVVYFYGIITSEDTIEICKTEGMKL
jgi:hypothetical protein